MNLTRDALRLCCKSLYQILFFLVIIPLLFSCNTGKKLVEIDPAFAKYIQSYSSGTISKKSTIRIQIAGDARTTHTLHETIQEELFDFSPSVKGKAYWVDAKTIEFKADTDLNADQLYEVHFKLGSILEVPSKFKIFKFNIQIIKPSLQVEEDGLKSFGKDRMTMSGHINTADIEKSDLVEKLLFASLNGKELKIKWQHNEQNKTHGFLIDEIIRTNNESKLILEWKGSSIGSQIFGKKEMLIPAIGDFKVLDIRVIQNEEQYILAQFSDPLTASQQLDGLISVSNQENPAFTISGSEIKIFSSSIFEGSYTVNVFEGIENDWGKKIIKPYSANVFFENRLPSVKIQGKGVILPSSGGKVILPFEATNLKTVDVSIIKIYESNIPQFLQSNNLEGNDELRNVARPLVQTSIKLDEDLSIDLHKKNRFFLDLDKYIKTEPGAIYNVKFSFRPEYSMFGCADKIDSKKIDSDYEEDYDSNSSKDDDDLFWRKYYNYYNYGYNWNERNNPCHSSYYNGERFVSRNIISTNIGLTAKKGNDNNLLVSVNDLISTNAMSGVELMVTDFQQQIIGKGTSNNEGIAIISTSRKPYLLIAKKGTEKSYLRIDDGSALPLSRFDVSGVEIKSGIKGFIFGERGVWRPGDSLFLSCIIEDKTKKLPADHPIEMELLTPDGQLYKRMVAINSKDGFNVFKTVTDLNAPTGNWLCRVKIGGAMFEKRLKIETIMPNRLKIDLNFGKKAELGKNIIGNVELSANWLFGAPAQNLKAKVDVQLYKKQTIFQKYTQYIFDNPIASFSPQSKTIFDGTLSSTGTATINPNFDAGKQAPGMLLANLTVKVFEPGGSFSIDNISIPYHPFISYAGIKVPDGDPQWGFLQAGQNHNFNIVNLNTNGEPLNGKSTAEVSLYKIQWRWWWDNSGDNLSNFTQDQFNKLLKKETIEINNGKAIYSLQTKATDNGRYLILVKDLQSGHTTGKVFFVEDDNWRSRGNETSDGAAALLSFTSDKLIYHSGENVQLSIPSSEGGKLLISIENGSKILKTYQVKTTKGQTKFSFVAEKEMSPNIYVNLSLIQPHAQTINDLPIRMYGVLPIVVEDKNTILKPQITIQESIRPEKITSISISESSHKPMSYIIAIVDDGLLDLTHFKTPDPHDAFFAKEALGVKSWDLYDYVIGAWGGELQRILTIGGDAEAELSSKTRRANRFTPVIKFLGPFKSNGGTNTHSFSLPAYMGSVRVMVVAAGDGSYGMAEKTVKVKKPIMLLATLPRVLGESESIKIPVTVFATESSIKNVQIRIESNSFLEGSGPQTISFNNVGEQTAIFSARVKDKTGIGKIKVTAASGNEHAEFALEVDIRNPNPLLTKVTEATLEPGKSWSGFAEMIGESISSKATLELSTLPAINLQKRLKYLIEYPHGCIEQTTSAVFPQLFLSQLVELNDQRKALVENNIKSAIQKIQNFQNSDGGFAYWAGENSDDWGTCYAGHFLTEANAKGYNVPSSILQQWKTYLKSKSSSWNKTVAPLYGEDLVQAYRLFLLALNKAPELGAMNRLKEYKFLTVEAKWRLAAAYHLSGQTRVALELISGLPTQFSKRAYWGMSYGSDLRDEAMVLETLIIMNRRSEAEQLVRNIAALLAQDEWYSTQTTAYSLMAIAKFSGTNNTANKLSITGKVGTQNMLIKTSSNFTQNDVEWKNGKANVQLTNNGNQVVYVRLINEGQPLGTTIVPSIINPEILIITASYFTTSGVALDPTKIKQGTDFVAKVVIKNPGKRGAYQQMALTQLFPAGWEILNTRLYNSEGAYKSSPSSYMDIRDDRVNHYFNIKAGEELVYYVQLNAAYLGKYFWPGIYCEAMYDHSISASVSGKWVEVE